MCLEPLPQARLAPPELRAPLWRVLPLASAAALVALVADGSDSAPARRPAEFRPVQERL